jgi:hypothetical protein
MYTWLLIEYFKYFPIPVQADGLSGIIQAYPSRLESRESWPPIPALRRLQPEGIQPGKRQGADPRTRFEPFSANQSLSGPP